MAILQSPGLRPCGGFQLWSQLIVLSACVLFVAPLTFGQNDETGTPDAEESKDVPTTSDATALRLINNYLAASGGAARHEQIRAVRATGTMREGRAEYRFELTETREGARRLKLTWRNYEDTGRVYETLRVTDGTRAGTWTQALRPRNLDPESFTGGEAAFFTAHQWFFLPFLADQIGAWTFTYEGTTRTLGRDAYLVRGYGPKDTQAWFHFDKKTFLVIRHGGLVRSGNTPIPQDYAVATFQKRGGVHLPNGFHLMTEKGRFGSITFDNIELNPEIKPSLFSEPEPSSEVWLRQAPE